MIINIPYYTTDRKCVPIGQEHLLDDCVLRFLQLEESEWERLKHLPIKAILALLNAKES